MDENPSEVSLSIREGGIVLIVLNVFVMVSLLDK